MMKWYINICEGQDKVTFVNKGGRNRDEEE